MSLFASSRLINIDRYAGRSDNCFFGAIRVLSSVESGTAPSCRGQRYSYASDYSLYILQAVSVRN